MLNAITTHFVGLDVHQATDEHRRSRSGEGEPQMGPTIPNDFKTLMKSLKRLGELDHLMCCYEAGPTGYGLYRQFKKARYSLYCDCSFAGPRQIRAANQDGSPRCGQAGRLPPLG